MVANRSIEAIVGGRSAGAIEASASILPALKYDFSIPIVLAPHMPPDKPSLLASVLAPHCALPVKEAEDKEPIMPETVYMVAPNYHLLIEKRRHFSFTVDDPIFYCRPSIDVLVESVAEAYGENLAAFLLTGANEDGAQGIAEVGAAGGMTIVQSPETASVPILPADALREGPVDHVLPLDPIGFFLANRNGLPTAREAE